MDGYCETPGHEDRPAKYMLDGKKACQIDYRAYRKQHPLPPRTPSLKPPRRRPTAKACTNEHPWINDDGSLNYWTGTDGRKVCRTCHAPKFCSTPGHEDKPAEYTVNDAPICQACYRQGQRRARGLKLPGPKPEPVKPFSRYSDSNSSHHATGETPQHSCGQPFGDVTYPHGVRRCLSCDPLVVSVECRYGHPRSKYAYERPKTPYTPGCRRCDAIIQVAMRYRSKYGFSQEDIQNRLEAQDYKCPVCKKPYDPDNCRRPEVDHDHTCCPGQLTCRKCVRDIICQPCNRMLGGAEDDVVALQGGIDYVNKWKRSFNLQVLSGVA